MSEKLLIRKHIREKLKEVDSFIVYNQTTFYHVENGYNVYNDVDHQYWAGDFNNAYETFCDLSGWDTV